MKNFFINDVLCLMSGKLSADQELMLKEIMRKELRKYELVKSRPVPSENHDEALDYMEDYLRHLKQSGYSSGTHDLYRVRIKHFLTTVNKPVFDITTNDIREYLSTYQETKHVSNRTLDSIRKNLRGFFTWMFLERIIGFNPTAPLRPIKFVQTIPKPYSEEEMEKIKGSCTTARDLALVHVLYTTGARVSEISSLDREDIHDNEAIILGKGGFERHIYFSDSTMYYINKYLKTRTDDNPALFVSLRKPFERLLKPGIEARVKMLGKKAGLSKVHPHRYRHTLANKCLSRGMSVHDVQKILGHKQIKTTMMYLDIQDEDVKHAHRKLIG